MSIFLFRSVHSFIFSFFEQNCLLFFGQIFSFTAGRDSDFRSSETTCYSGGPALQNKRKPNSESRESGAVANLVCMLRCMPKIQYIVRYYCRKRDAEGS